MLTARWTLRRIRTKRRTPTPANITFPGENTCHIYMRVRCLTSSHVAYQANTLPKRLGEGIEDIDSWIKPLCPSIIGTSGLTWPLDLLMKDGENIGWRVAVLELGGEWMGK
jgi:hypothetical protein